MHQTIPLLLPSAPTHMILIPLHPFAQMIKNQFKTPQNLQDQPHLTHSFGEPPFSFLSLLRSRVFVFIRELFSWFGLTLSKYVRALVFWLIWIESTFSLRTILSEMCGKVRMNCFIRRFCARIGNGQMIFLGFLLSFCRSFCIWHLLSHFISVQPDF